MRVLIACKRGNIAERSASGHCQCVDCKAFRAAYQKASPKRKESKAAWLTANKEKSASYTKKWNAENSAQRREIERAWKAANPEKVAAMNAKAGAKWAANNKGRRLASVRARQIAKLHRTPVWADLAAVSEIYVRCVELTKKTGIPHEVDHILPLQGKTVSGLHIAANLQIITRHENRSKGINLCAA